MDSCEDKNPKNTEKWTPLHYAAFYGHSEIVQIILDLVADKNPKTSYGDTPLHFAAKEGHIIICEIILDVIEEKNPRKVVLLQKVVRNTIVPQVVIYKHLLLKKILLVKEQQEENLFVQGWKECLGH